MKLKNVLAGVAASLALAGVAVAQPYGTGPGMMGGYGGGYGMGPGMMGGYGGGYGTGPGMMGGYGGGYGMGPGMMGGYANDAFAGLDLKPEQRKAIADIQQQSAKAMWQLMGKMHEQGYHMQGMYGPGPVDEAAARKAFQEMTEAQKAMFELQLDARKKIDAVLTQEQRDKLRSQWGSR